jgi:radical SAM superfamily enzyme YgiQ (UPF0313 family)
MTKDIKKVLLVNLPFEKIYEATTMKGVAPATPPLGLACIAGSLERDGHVAKIFDFNISNEEEFKKVLEEENPDCVGISFVTPLIKEADKVARIVKDFDDRIVVIGGGPHCSSFPESVLQETCIDIVVIGEGDFTILDIVNEKDLEDIKGVGYLFGGTPVINPRREYIKDLDELAFPAWHLYDIAKYKTPSAIAKKNPVCWIESSRGCIYGCVFCNKHCFGRTFRVKSPQRVVEEFIKVRDLGFKEIHLTDDGFTTDMERAERICDLLIEKKVNIGWSTITGIRVDRVNPILLKKMRQAGCYRVYYGIESGNQQILDNIHKGITLEQVRQAVKWAKEAKLSVAGYFMLGLPGETEATMQDTINFAKELNLDLAKVSITIPLPATELFNELDKAGKIKTKDWEMFKFYSVPSTIYDHQNLSWETINKYYNMFYSKVYFNPRFILKRFRVSIRDRTLLADAKMALSLKKGRR